MVTEPGGHNFAADRHRLRLRASHADREQVVDVLKAAFVQGRLTKDELDTRIGQAFTSRTYADLAAVTADLPPARPRPRGRRRRSTSRRPPTWPSWRSRSRSCCRRLAT